MPHLWNQPPSSFRQPHSVHSPPSSPHLAHITSSQSPPSLSSSICHSLDLFLQTYIHLFHISIISSVVFMVLFRLLSLTLDLDCMTYWALAFVSFSFYRAMHFSAKRGIAIACRLSVCLSVCPSVCLSVCNVGEL